MAFLNPSRLEPLGFHCDAVSENTRLCQTDLYLSVTAIGIPQLSFDGCTKIASAR